MKHRSPLLRKLDGLEFPTHRIFFVRVRLRDLANPAKVASADKAPNNTSLSPGLITTLKILYSPLAHPVPSLYLFIH
jgi:hypothetical protein